MRFIHDLSDKFKNELHAFLHCPEPKLVNIKDVDYELVSYPSMGMNFSNMSQSLGTDKLGRAAGKVMGMASYGQPLPNYYNRYNVTHQLEIDSFNYTMELIQRAIEYKPDCKNIILSGGFSLNCTNNYKYLESLPDYQIFVDPIPHDGGTAAGAALQMYEKMNHENLEYCKPSVWSES
jgi:predicted NodU family carbamoyl transferase